MDTVGARSRANVLNKHDSANVPHRRFYLSGTQAPDHSDISREVENNGRRLRAECGGEALAYNSSAGMVLTVLCWPRVYFSR